MLLVRALLIISFWAGAAVEAQSWQRIGTDLEFLEYKISDFEVLGAPLFFLRTSLRRFSLDVVDARQYQKDRLSVREMAEASGALVAVNANFFDTDGKALGLVIRDHTILTPLHRGGRTLTGVFGVEQGLLRFIGRADFDSQKPDFALAVQAGPRLLMQGKLVPGIERQDAVSRRAGVCLDEGRRLVLFSSKAGFGGFALGKLAAVLQDAPFNCREALNFDGGGSAQMYVSPKIPGHEREWQGVSVSGDSVPVALVLKSRP